MSEPLRRHWQAKLAGVFIQVPIAAANVWPTATIPLIAGKSVFTGAAAAAVTVTLLETCGVEPLALVAVTRHVTSPISALARRYVELVAPLISTPARIHWYVKLTGSPNHDPVEQVRVSPT